MKRNKSLIAICGLVGILVSCNSTPVSSTLSSSTSNSHFTSSSLPTPSSSTSSVTSKTYNASIEFGTTIDNSISSTPKLSDFKLTNINIKSIDSEYCYMKKDYSMRFSSSKNAGSLTLNFNSNINISNVKVYTCAYSSKESGNLTVSTTSYTSSKDCNTSTSFDNTYLSFDNIGSTSSLNFKGVAKNRFYVSKIELTYSTSSSGGSISSDSSTSSATSSSSSSSSSSSTSGPEEGYYSMDLSTIQNQSYKNHGSYSSLGEDNTPSLGDVKLLVVPVYFSGDSAPTSTQLDILNKAFFGETSETGYESLSSYYKKSSYNKLNLGGFITPSYQYSMSASAFQTAYENNTKDTNDVVDDVISWAEKNKYIDSSFDSNNDGYYDGIEIVYFTSKTQKDNSDLWWAYTTSCNYEKSSSGQVAGRYFWSPYSMVQTGYYDIDIDAHTLIHETGHMLGLDDYYSYDTNSSGYSDCGPCGMVDMMDFNVGDHNAFSKMLLGWVSPKVAALNKDFTITLNSFTETGDFILIPTSKYNNTIYDEYVILQYYTPTGLNQADSIGYKDWSTSGNYGHGGTYTSSGLQMFHIDNRIASCKYNNGTYSSLAYSSDPLTEEKQNSDGSYTLNIFTAHSNSSSYSYNIEKSSSKSGTSSNYISKLVKGSSNKLISIIPGNGTDAFLNSGFEDLMGTNDNLFTKDKYNSYSNSTHSKCYTNNGKMDNGTYFPYSFTITDQTSSSITISFTLN